MNQAKKYRYPGINSFETTDTDIFFGREDDRAKLADLVEIEKNVLLYAKSGLGKSSLLKAALMPELASRGYQCFYIRLGLYQEDSLPPVQNVIRRTVLAEQKQLPATFLQKFVNRTNSLWYTFKALQVSSGENDHPVVIIFDQFEEFGSYQARHITEFKQQVAELIYTPIPKDFLDALKDDDLLTELLTDDELDLLYKPLRVKVVFALRSDQMSVVNELSDYLPNILKVNYELKPLSQTQAMQAIVEPGKRNGDFITPTFSYQQDALKKIIKALASEKSSDIDTAQLQILLQYVEQDIVEKKGDVDITADDLGDLNKVYEGYYLNSLRKLKDPKELDKAQRLIEDKLIVEGRRISYDKALCLQLVRQQTMDELIETRLLRREPNTMGGYSYEVSHDSLVAPILETGEKRRRREQEAENEQARLAFEAKKKAEYEAQLAEEKRKAEEIRQKAEFESQLAEEKRKSELAEQARINEQYEAQIANQRKAQRQQRITLIIVSVFLLTALILGSFAWKAQVKARTFGEQTRDALRQVEKEKAGTQHALNDFIRADNARKSIEIEQLHTDIKTFLNSRDFNLARIAQLKADSLEHEITEAMKKIKQ